MTQLWGTPQTHTHTHTWCVTGTREGGSRRLAPAQQVMATPVMRLARPDAYIPNKSRLLRRALLVLPPLLYPHNFLEIVSRKGKARLRDTPICSAAKYSLHIAKYTYTSLYYTCHRLIPPYDKHLLGILLGRINKYYNINEK